MTFPEYETSLEKGIPVSLFYFKYGPEDDNIWAYCDTDTPIIFEEIEYKPVVIGRDRIENSGGLDRQTLNIQITPNAEIVQYYKTYQPTHQVSLIIRQGHADDPDHDYRVVWSGRIKNISLKTDFATISGESLVTALKRPGLRRNYQYGCPHALYSSPCGASMNTGRRLATSILPFPDRPHKNFFIFADGWQKQTDPAKFKNGFVRWYDPEARILQTMSILDITRNPDVYPNYLILVNGRTSSAPAGTQVEIYLGCNRQESDCINLHNNIRNFGGQPWIPLKNPINNPNLL